ncbi:MAG: hypothetical protein ABI647_24270 [Gemmatimonadota bacterium]
MRSVTDGEGVEWTLIEIGGYTAGPNRGPGPHAVVLRATGGSRPVLFEAPVDWKDVPREALLERLSGACRDQISDWGAYP